MACFTVPVAEAIVTTAITKIVKSKEKAGKSSSKGEVMKVKLSEKLSWLNKMLLGGSALLAFEHVWHGEVIPAFPFLTAVTNGETSEMLHEMGTVGVTMSVLVTLVWIGMVAISSALEKRKTEETVTIGGARS
ncbi:hypothetical protein SAMN02910370_01669 [Lachnospiraceae bacterium XPB1003]|nr:hypothetical protein SAMN02910370_01669 [Lachnospiraceae bacterium XPB1003]